jgi:plasmid stability protein
MTELRVTVPDEIAERLAFKAAEEGSSAEDVAAEVLRLHAPHGPRDGLGFIALARAKSGFSAKLAEERLEAEGFI